MKPVSWRSRPARISQGTCARPQSSYSPNNVLLILSQRPDATRVAGYKTWQALGRQVKKGEKAISIFAPRPYRVTTEDETGEEQSRLAQDHVGAGDVGGCAGSGLHHGAGQMLRHLHPLEGAELSYHLAQGKRADAGLVAILRAAGVRAFIRLPLPYCCPYVQE